jgi:tetratricopeptide (TPR) repeat protein
MKALNRLDDAEVFLKKLESSGKAWQPSLVLAELMVVKGNLNDAIIHIEKALDISQQAKLVKQKAASLYQLKGIDLRTKKQLPEARNYFLKAIKLYPESPGFLSNLIETEIAAENIPEAQKLLDQFIKTEANLAARYYLQGVIRFAEKNPEEGLKQYRLSWGSKPTEKAAESIYGYYQQNGLTQEKERFLDEWVEKIPNSYRVAFIKAVEAQNKNNKEDAIHWYEKTLAAAPNTPVALNNLAWLYYESKDPRALALAEKAVQFAPKSASILDTYGWIMVETGSIQEGIGILQKASDLEPGNAEIKDHLEQAKARRK